jgi:hypothetical protein
MVQKKKIGVLAVLLLAAYIPLQAQTFGRYADCTTGRGICGIQTENIGDKEPLRVATQKFILRYQTDSTVQLVLIKANMNSTDEYKIFGTRLAMLPDKKPGFVYLDEAVPLTKTQLGRLGMPAKYSALAPGAYTVVVTETYFISELKLQ